MNPCQELIDIQGIVLVLLVAAIVCLTWADYGGSKPDKRAK